MPIIFLDESGYTGSDLFNEVQPVFVIATLNIDEETCANLKQRFFGAVKAKELKHSALCRHPKQQEMVTDFLENLGSNHQIAKMAVAHKRFALVCQSVNLVVEEAAHVSGLDIYHQGFNLALSNALFYVIPALGGHGFFSDLLLRFQNMARQRTPRAYDDFFSFVFQRHEDQQLNQLLDYFRICHHLVGYSLLETIPEDALDLGFTLALNRMAEWRGEISDPIQLVHDISSSMSKQKYIWDALMDPNLRPAEIGYDSRRARFPIAIKRTSFEPSEKWVGLQLADIVAGAMARYRKWLCEGQNQADHYAQQLSSSLADMPAHLIWPDLKFGPEELGATGEDAENPIDYIVDAIRKTRPVS